MQNSRIRPLRKDQENTSNTRLQLLKVINVLLLHTLYMDCFVFPTQIPFHKTKHNPNRSKERNKLKSMVGLKEPAYSQSMQKSKAIFVSRNTPMQQVSRPSLDPGVETQTRPSWSLQMPNAQWHESEDTRPDTRSNQCCSSHVSTSFHSLPQCSLEASSQTRHHSRHGWSRTRMLE